MHVSIVIDTLLTLTLTYNYGMYVLSMFTCYIEQNVCIIKVIFYCYMLFGSVYYTTSLNVKMF